MEQKTSLQVPSRPDGIYRGPSRVVDNLDQEYINVNGYSGLTNRILTNTVSDVEVTVNMRSFERMENDATIAKAKLIIVTKVLADELQFAPGATESEVNEDEYGIYVDVMNFCKRMITGLDRPYRETLEQLLGNGIRYGHGVAESNWDYVEDEQLDEPAPPDVTKKQNRIGAFFSNLKQRVWAADDTAPETKSKEIFKGKKLRLMPVSIKVKPREATRFVVDDYMTVIGLVPRYRGGRTVRFDEVITREKFLILTLKKENEDPRGKSFYRPAFNWHNVKTQMPTETLRFVLETIVPKTVGKLPPDGAAAYEQKTDADGNPMWEDEERRRPEMLSPFESMANAMRDFRSGSGIIIHNEADLQPYHISQAAADFFPKIIDMIDKQMENSILLQSLAQSEGAHQARSAAQVHSDLLEILVFWIRWILAVMTLTDLCEVGVRKNFGDWAVRYLPFASLGDFVRRDWAKDLEVVAKAYFWGFLDDTQRAELMAWLNLPKPGPSRQEEAMANMANTDINGNPVVPNDQRPDKQSGNKKRNVGNGTEKKNDNTKPSNKTSGRNDLYALGHHGTGTMGSARTVFRRDRTR